MRFPFLILKPPDQLDEEALIAFSRMERTLAAMKGGGMPNEHWRNVLKKPWQPGTLFSETTINRRRQSP